MKNWHRRTVLGLGAAAAGIAALPAWAQRGPIRIFVGFPPGGLPDLVARALAEQFKRSFDLPAVVENRPGANGRIAGQAVKNGASDGTIFLVAPASGMVHLPHVYNDLGFDPLTDFAPVAQLCENDFALAINAKLPAQNIKEFAQWAQAQPAQASFASPGTGSSPHMMGLQMARALGIKLTHVPYRGSNLGLADVVGGHVAGMVASTSFFMQPVKAGSLRVLATTGRARSSLLPQVPTFQELGMPQLTMVEGTWLLAPAKTPAAVVDKYAAAAIEALKSREMQGFLDGQTLPAPLGPKDLAKLMREEFDRRGASIKAIGFTAAE
ncbi:MAG: twin-arginine translocation pathway signal protein [Rhodoferax sp.]|jgi:tripartite-type tricarboxylate transporter receptor subunit TctC|nr:twin-arginine translocation pathway signal protein [Rhodoferax sp.]